MSSDAVVLTAEKREVQGKKVRSIRREGFVPGVVYEKGKESVDIQMQYMPMAKVFSVVGKGLPVELHVEKKQYLTMIKDVHMDPVKNTIMHVAFHAVNKNDPVEAEVPVHLQGEVPAEKVGNFIVRANDHVMVRALPADLPEMLIVEADKLVEPGDSLTVADIIPVPKVEILSEPELALATVEEPRVAEEPEPSGEISAADVPADNGGDKSEEA